MFIMSEYIKFNNTDIDSYKITNNQQKHLYINSKKYVKNPSEKYDFTYFTGFLNNFDVLEPN